MLHLVFDFNAQQSSSYVLQQSSSYSIDGSGQQGHRSPLLEAYKADMAAGKYGSQRKTRVLGPTEHVGLGLRLERSTQSPDIYIQEIVPGFAAHESGKLRLRDVVVSVDHIPLMEMELEAVKQLTIGEEGSYCTLQIQRGDHYFQVTLMRQFPYQVTKQNVQALHAISDSQRPVGDRSRSPQSRSHSPKPRSPSPLDSRFSL